jgi:hypothetical protein
VSRSAHPDQLPSAGGTRRLDLSDREVPAGVFLAYIWPMFSSPKQSARVSLCLAGDSRVRRFVPEPFGLLVSSESDSAALAPLLALLPRLLSLTPEMQQHARQHGVGSATHARHGTTREVLGHAGNQEGAAPGGLWSCGSRPASAAPRPKPPKSRRRPSAAGPTAPPSWRRSPSRARRGKPMPNCAGCARRSMKDASVRAPKQLVLSSTAGLNMASGSDSPSHPPREPLNRREDHSTGSFLDAAWSEGCQRTC